MGTKAPMKLTQLSYAVPKNTGGQAGGQWLGVSWSGVRERGRGQGEVNTLTHASGILGTWTGTEEHLEIP